MMVLRQFKALIVLSLLDLYRRKDLLVLLVLSLVLLVPLALIKPFGVAGASRYMNEIAMLLIWIFSLVISLGVSSRLFPPEFESRTIYPMFAKPVSRGVLLFGKYLGALVASLSALALFYLLYALISGFRQGVWFPPMFFQAFLLHVGFVVLVTAFGLLGSLVVTPSANLTLSGLAIVCMLLFGQRLPAIIATQPAPINWVLSAVYALGPHVEFFDLRRRLIHDWEMIPWFVCGLVLIYAICYAAVCLWLAGLALRHKKI